MLENNVNLMEALRAKTSNTKSNDNFENNHVYENLTQNLTEKTVRLSEDELKEKVRILAGDNIDLLRSEGELELKISQLQLELETIKKSEIQKDSEYNNEICQIFLNLLPQLDISDAAREALANATKKTIGTREATREITYTLKYLASNWLVEVEEAGNFTQWTEDALKILDKQIDEIKKNHHLVSSIEHDEIAYWWHRIEGYRIQFLVSISRLITAVSTAVQAIQSAQSTVVAAESPAVIQSVFITAIKTRATAINYISNLHPDYYELEGAISRVGYFVDDYLRTKKEEISRNSDSPNSRYSADSIGETDRTFGSNVEAYEYTQFEPFPAVNPATGLPMLGGSSPIDVCGNLYGTNNDWL
jgi:hypothetical protein